MADDQLTTPAPPPTIPSIADLLESTAPGAATPGTATPKSAFSDMPLTAEQRAHSLQVSLADLTARASGHYASKRFDDAAEVYAQAAEMQAEMNGEMAPENAEILFLYGRSLFRVGQSKSDVLGGKAPETEGQQAKGGKSKKGKVVKKKKGPNGAAAGAAGSSKEEQELVAEKVVEEAAKIVADEAAAAEVKTEKKELEEKKPLFQFTGDENWDDSDEEEDEGAEDEDGEEGEDEVEDDLGTAFEILDLSRVLFLKQLEDKTAAAASASSAYEDQGKGKEVANGGAEQGDHSDATLQHIKERLADTHDLLAEISLENERYPNAIADARESLKYKKQLMGEDHEIIAEAHFKLSLALEFASVTAQEDEAGANAGPKEVNQELRDEAARELEAAIASTKLKLQNKEVELATLHSPEDNEITRRQIADTKEIIADMEQRLVDLRGPPIDMQAALGGEAIGGILGAALGQSAVETEARIEEAKKTATDLTGLVRKKGKPTAAAPEAPVSTETTEKSAEVESGTNNKRKAEDDVVIEDESSKKPRTEEAETTA